MDRSRPILYAHRGAAAEQPENTMQSFRRALELGADALEMDAHMTSDGHVVVAHDPLGARMCGVSAAIKNNTFARVGEWDAGWGFVDDRGGRPFAGKGYCIPSLDQVLTELPGVPLNLDLKQSSSSMVQRAIDLIRSHRAEDRVILASFQLRTLLEVRARGYRGMTALSKPEVAALVFAPRLAFRALPFTGVAAQLPVAVGPIDLATHRIVDKCHALDMRVDYWTINRPETARELLELGADGIMTDDPATIAPVITAFLAA